MSIVGLFILSAVLLASIWAGKVALLDAALMFFAAAVATDIIAMSSSAIKKYLAIRNTEVVFNGMAQGNAPKELRDAIGEAARKAGLAASGKRPGADGTDERPVK